MPKIAPPKNEIRNCQGRFTHFEYTADGRRDGELETDDTGSMIEQRFTFQYARLPLGQRHFLAERRHCDRIGQPERCTERKCRSEQNRRPYGMQCETDRHHGRDRQTDIANDNDSLTDFISSDFVNFVRFRIQQRRDEQHHEQFRAERYVRKERQL